MRHLRNVIMDRRAMDEWSRYLSFVQRILNTMTHSSTGVKPCEIILSNEMSHESLKLVRKEDIALGSGEEPPPSEKPEWEDLWIDRLKERQRWYVEKAVASLKAMDDLHRSAAPVVTTRYETGSLVLSEQGTAFRRGPEHKLLPFCRVPLK